MERETREAPPHRVRRTILDLVAEMYDRAPLFSGEIRVTVER